jgi:cysteine desulfuration protein SufE
MIPVKLKETLDYLRTIDDREMRADFLCEFAARFTGVPERIWTRPYPKERRVPGCESEAYAFLEVDSDHKIILHFAVENPQGISAKALAIVLKDGLDGCSVDEATEIPADLVYDIFGQHLTMGKGQGLMGMVQMVRSLAKLHKLQLG